MLSLAAILRLFQTGMVALTYCVDSVMVPERGDLGGDLEVLL